MNVYFKAFLITACVLLITHQSFAKEWHGLAPLRSTRADVVRLLGQCSEEKEACLFTLDQQEVYILFSGGLRDEYQDCAKRLPPETVMFIQVRPKAKVKLDDLKLNRRMLQEFKSAVRMTRGDKAYHTNNGLLIDTSRGLVIRQIYVPDPSDLPHCPSYYERPESFVERLWHHPPPIINIDCPATTRAGTDLILRLSSTAEPKRGPLWRTSAGKIVSGQHTYKITIDTSGVAARLILVQAELHLPEGHAAATSCEIVVLPR